MINLIKAKIRQIKQKRQQKKHLKKMREYYKVLRQGAIFLNYIQKDIEKASKEQLNRHQRRRWLKQLNEKGKFSPEMIEHYANRVDLVLKQIHLQLNPPKKGK